MAIQGILVWPSATTQAAIWQTLLPALVTLLEPCPSHVKDIIVKPVLQSLLNAVPSNNAKHVKDILRWAKLDVAASITLLYENSNHFDVNEVRHLKPNKS